MTEKQLKLIYADACSAVSRTVDPAQFETWKPVLLRFEQPEVRAALEAWWNDTEPLQGNLLGKVRGSTMPGPADLKARVLAAHEKRRENSAAYLKRQAEIVEFWRWVEERKDHYGETEAELLERFPSYRGTKPEVAA